MNGLTINDLAKYCAKQIKNGNGDKKILISNDDEGNGYHELFYEFSETKDVFEGKYPPSTPYHLSDKQIENEYIILG